MAFLAVDTSAGKMGRFDNILKPTITEEDENTYPEGHPRNVVADYVNKMDLKIPFADKLGLNEQVYIPKVSAADDKRFMQDLPENMASSFTGATRAAELYGKPFDYAIKEVIQNERLAPSAVKDINFKTIRNMYNSAKDQMTGLTKHLLEKDNHFKQFNLSPEEYADLEKKLISENMQSPTNEMKKAVDAVKNVPHEMVRKVEPNYQTEIPTIVNRKASMFDLMDKNKLINDQGVPRSGLQHFADEMTGYANDPEANFYPMFKHPIDLKQQGLKASADKYGKQANDIRYSLRGQLGVLSKEQKAKMDYLDSKYKAADSAHTKSAFSEQGAVRVPEQVLRDARILIGTAKTPMKVIDGGAPKDIDKLLEFLKGKK